VWVPKTCATWAYANGTRPVSVRRSALAGSALVRPEVDDLRLVGLKLVFLVVFRAMSLIRLSRRESWRKGA
jgi:hypothetical protein